MSYWSGFDTLWKKESIVNKLFLSLVGLVILSGCATTATIQTSPLTQVVEAIDIENTSKDVIFERSKIWMAKSFKSANNVIQYANKETGSIIGKGNIAYPCSGFMDCEAFRTSNVNFTIKIDTKENKARVTFEDISRYTPPSAASGIVFAGGDFPVSSVKQKEQVEARLHQMIASYKTDIASQQADANW
jgi:hypothetical protein